MTDFLVLCILVLELVNTIRHWRRPFYIYFPTNTTASTNSTWNYYEVGTPPPTCQADRPEED